MVDRRDAVVPALLRVQVPDDADPGAVEAEVLRAITASPGRAMTAELTWVPLLSRTEGPCLVLTYAVVLHGAAPPGRADDLTSHAHRAVTTALRCRFGATTRAAIRPARSREQLATCYRALRGSPRPMHP